MDDETIIRKVSRFTLTGRERILNVLQLVEKVVLNEVPGDFVEIGVFRGGLIMAMALKCQQLGVNRTIHAYDTFEGMTAPSDYDVDCNGYKASDTVHYEAIKCESTFDETKAIIDLCKYPNIVYHVGDIRETDISAIPSIALLRLDTDWYDLTKFELEHFEKRVEPKGYVIIDDYGHWDGCRKAVDEFLVGKDIKPDQIDYTGIYWEKTLF